MVKKVLFYTRLENNTGGDETFLFTIAQPLIKGFKNANMENTEDKTEDKIEVNLVLAYDDNSKYRASKFNDPNLNDGIKEKWMTMTESDRLTSKVWLNQRGKGNASFQKSITHSHLRTKIPKKGISLKKSIFLQ